MEKVEFIIKAEGNCSSELTIRNQWLLGSISFEDTVAVREVYEKCKSECLRLFGHDNFIIKPKY